MVTRTGAAVACALALIAFATWAAAPGAALAAVERPFHGVVLQRQLTPAEVDRLRHGELGSARFLISWDATETERGTYDWSATDDYVESIGSAGAVPLPFVFGVPGWLKPVEASGPLGTREAELAWQEFLVRLAARYGPNGTFVQDHPGATPVRTWQLWNEPNLTAYWEAAPSPRGYARMVELGAAALRYVDPGARIMLGGLSPAAKGVEPSRFLDRFLVASDPADFDVVALHPYGRSLRDAYAQIDRADAAMRRRGLATMPISITEIGWGSGGPRGHALYGTPETQAAKLTRTYADFAGKRWRIESAFWYAWRDLRRDPDLCGFCTFTGLLDRYGDPKPAWRAFKRSARSERAHVNEARRQR